MSDQGPKRKRGGNKRYYQNKHHKSGAGNGSSGAPPQVGHDSLHDNLSGFLVTCNSHEYQCLVEAYNVLNEAADTLYGQSNGDPVDGDHDEDDIELSIEREVQQLRSGTKRRFIQVKTKCKNLLFIRSNEPKFEPNPTAAQILHQIESQCRQSCRYIQRFVPVVATCKADPEKLMAQFEEIFERHAPKTVTSFAVQCRIRNNSNFSSQSQLQRQIADSVRSIRPNWIVNLNEPQVLVLINIVQRAVCISLLDHYNRYSKYNLVEFYRKCFQLKNQPPQQTASPTSQEVTTESADPKVCPTSQEVSTTESTDLKFSPTSQEVSTTESNDLKFSPTSQEVSTTESNDLKFSPTSQEVSTTESADPKVSPTSQEVSTTESADPKVSPTSQEVSPTEPADPKIGPAPQEVSTTESTDSKVSPTSQEIPTEASDSKVCPTFQEVSTTEPADPKIGSAPQEVSTTEFTDSKVSPTSQEIPT